VRAWTRFASGVKRQVAMKETFVRVKSVKRYELVAAALRSNIVSGRLQAGLVLLEGPIAGLMKTSRAPVQAALRILEEEKLIQRFSGRGYLVGRAGLSVEPVRRDIGKLGLRIPNEIDAALQNRGLWEVVYDEVESAVAACLIFGDFASSSRSSATSTESAEPSSAMCSVGCMSAAPNR